MSVTRTTRGIVLSIAPHAESDKLVTFYSPDTGLVTGIAKGAKRSKHRFVNKLEEFTLLSILYRPSRTGGLLFLSEAGLDNAFLSLRSEYPRYTTAMFVAELVLRFTREHDPDPEIFTLLHWALFSLDSGIRPARIAALFQVRLLDLAGYRPQLDGCGRCHTNLSPRQRYSLDPASGSLVCSRCRREANGSRLVLSLQTIRFLQQAQQLELRLLARLQMPARAATETVNVLTTYTRHLLQQDIHSRRFLPLGP
ncbi:MAG TPA: DNA repair protein RecO [Desulfobulbus sp.]|nr:DNA repair protein RecO [Desulfobulbus sp.]